MVEERGFEPPTPWSRTRFGRLLNFVDFRGSQVIDMESVTTETLKSIEPC